MTKNQKQFSEIFVEWIIAKPIIANENELNIILHFHPEYGNIQTSLRSAEQDSFHSKSFEKYGMHSYKYI